MKRTLSILLMLALMAAACAFAEGDQEAENYTRYFDYTPVENAPIGLVAWETRLSRRKWMRCPTRHRT